MSLKEIFSLVLSLAGHPCSKSYYHLALVVYQCSQLEVFSGFCLERQAYPSVASQCGISTRAVSRNIARAADDFWDYGNRSYLEEITGRSFAEKPSPKELVFHLCLYIRNSQK